MASIIKLVGRQIILQLTRAVITFLPTRVLAFVSENVSIIRQMDYDGEPIKLNIKSRWEYVSRLRSCAAEPETVEWIREFVKEGDVLFDIGANVGAYSLVAARCTSGKATIYSFEPAFPNFGQLCRNIFINGCEETITPIPIAITDETNFNTFNYQNISSGGAFHAVGEAIDFKGDSFHPVLQLPVVSYRLDDFVSQFGLKHPNHIKIDVDGIEYAVLKGAVNTLSDPDLLSMLIEAEPDKCQTKELFNLLHKMGFTVHSQYEHVSKDERGSSLRTYNYILVKQ